MLHHTMPALGEHAEKEQKNGAGRGGEKSKAYGVFFFSAAAAAVHRAGGALAVPKRQNPSTAAKPILQVLSLQPPPTPHGVTFFHLASRLGGL